MISDEAVEAAAKALAPNAFGWERWPDDYRARARKALEAAEPYMNADAWQSCNRAALDRPNPSRSQA